tara:strand:- start:13618 stop:14355 length:738 start_codon:yes stop_codon:yes gene_type:complete
MNETLIDTSTEEVAETTEATEAVETVETPDRPEWLPEKYKTGEDLAKAYKELESKLGNKDESLRKEIEEELNVKRYENRPENKGDYKLPEGIDEGEAVESELMQWWAEHSFENGYSQEMFETGIEKYMEAFGQEAVNIDDEMIKLGDQALARTDAASAFATKFFPKEVIPAIERMAETHEGIIALEHIMDSLKSPSLNQETDVAATINESDLRTMMNDERYHNPTKRDPAYVKNIEDGFKKLYGT